MLLLMWPRRPWKFSTYPSTHCQREAWSHYPSTPSSSMLLLLLYYHGWCFSLEGMWYGIVRMVTSWRHNSPWMSFLMRVNIYLWPCCRWQNWLKSLVHKVSIPTRHSILSLYSNASLSSYYLLHGYLAWLICPRVDKNLLSYYFNPLDWVAKSKMVHTECLQNWITSCRFHMLFVNVFIPLLWWSWISLMTPDIFLISYCGNQNSVLPSSLSHAPFGRATEHVRLGW